MAVTSECVFTCWVSISAAAVSASVPRLARVQASGPCSSSTAGTCLNLPPKSSTPHLAICERSSIFTACKPVLDCRARVKNPLGYPRSSTRNNGTGYFLTQKRRRLTDTCKRTVPSEGHQLQLQWRMRGNGRSQYVVQVETSDTTTEDGEDVTHIANCIFRPSVPDCTRCRMPFSHRLHPTPL